MPKIRPGLAAAAALLLTACAPSSPLAGDLDLMGMDPFWAIQINAATKMSRVSLQGSGDIAAAYPVQSRGAAKDSIVLTSQSPAGDIVMTLVPSGTCQDGMSDRKYPWAATVSFKGQTFQGCAGPKEETKD
jgi:uncharacterized membrane protein